MATEIMTGTAGSALPRTPTRRLGPVAVPADFDARAAALAGLAAGAVYLEAMELDLAFFRRNTDDLVLLGRPFVKRPKRARPAGLAIHLGNSMALAVVYALFADVRLSGAPWWRGVLFASLENVALYPLTALDKRHPAVRDGQIDRYWNAEAFVQSIPRHAAYGAVLGLLYDRWRRKPVRIATAAS